MLIVIIELLFALVVSVSGARILGIAPMPSFSHQMAFRSIWRELSLRGHEVYVLTTDPQNDPRLVNLTEVSLRHCYKHKIQFEDQLEHLSNMEVVQEVRVMMGKVTEDFISNKQLQTWINESKRFDLVLVETFYPEFLILGEIFDCPKILICSLDTSTAIHRYIGNQIHGVAFDEYNLPFAGEKTVLERLFATLYHVFIRNFPGFEIKNRILKKYFGETAPSVEELLRKVDMTFLNTNPIFDSRGLAATTITYGPFIHIREPAKLPQDLKEYLDSATDGAIYFSLGSNVRSRNLKEEKLATIVDTLSKLPYKIIWKYEDELPKLPSNVKIVKWVPQQDILRHPNMKLFITQGGVQSMEEAIHCHVPMIILPVFGDQFVNAKRLHEKGVGIYVEHNPTLSGDRFREAILDVINNPKYKENIIELHRLLLDQPMTGLEKIVWWTEYVIRNKGAKHLRNPLLDIPLYQYYYLDIIAVVLLVLYTVYTILKFILRLILVLFRSKKVDDKKSQ